MLMGMAMVFCSCAGIFPEGSDGATNTSESIESVISTDDVSESTANNDETPKEEGDASSSESSSGEGEADGNSSTQTPNDSGETGDNSVEEEEKTDVEFPEVVLP